MIAASSGLHHVNCQGVILSSTAAICAVHKIANDDDDDDDS